ncbi:major facilitator superfamily domain-containing protein [Phycomyces blakesleeanus]|uniref:Major facilitator superfamily domain-containing protein n=1 Tax=Phycomyces blakesleeanus TaxID=4837 RepID=A0ABR3AXC3_PHYBL
MSNRFIKQKEPAENDELLGFKAQPWHRWCVLFSFSFLSFSSALMWITFAPCLYDFVEYYFQSSTTTTINAISSMSSIYMLSYPFVIHFTFRYFEDYKTSQGNVPGNGLRRGILIGAVLNACGAIVRWLGNGPSPAGFAFVFLGQTLAAVAQAFILSIPPRLAVAWFPENEINLATAIAVSCNSLGIAAGCAWSPLAIQKETIEEDIPRLLLMQCLMCLFVLLLICLSFRESPPYPERIQNEASSSEQIAELWKQWPFIYMLVAYAISMGAQCTVVTLLAQIIMPPFEGRVDERYIGLLGSMMLLVGALASVFTGYYLDRTHEYRRVCNMLFFITCLSGLGLSVATEQRSLSGIVVSCGLFGLSSSAIIPAICQYASELFYPVSEIIPAGYLFTVGNIAGVLMVAIMGWSQDEGAKYSMRLPMLGLTLFLFIGAGFMVRVNGQLKRSNASLL